MAVSRVRAVSVPWDSLPQEAVQIDSQFLGGLQLVADGGVTLPQFTARQTLRMIPSFNGLSVSQNGKGFLRLSGTAPAAVYGVDSVADGRIIDVPAGSDWTQQYVIDNVSGASANPGFFRSNSTQSGTTFLVNNGGANRPWVRVNGANILQPASGPAWVAGQTLNLLVRLKSSARVEVWWDGQLKHSATHATAQEAMTGVNGIYFLMSQSSTDWMFGNLVAFRHWNTYLDDDQMSSLAQNPAALYEPQQIIIPVAITATAGVQIGAGIGDASASGLPAEIVLHTSVNGAIGDAAATGLSAVIAEHTQIGGAIGTASATGLVAQVVEHVVVAAGVGNATASGLPAQISEHVQVAGTVGDASATGLPVGVVLHTQIDGLVGVADASGLPVVVAEHIQINAGFGAAAAAGLTAAINTASGAQINAGVGDASATGLTAGIVLPTTIGASIGSASASGFQAVVAEHVVISGNVANATADGLAAGIVISTRIDCVIGSASASGLAATINVVTGGSGASAADVWAYVFTNGLTAEQTVSEIRSMLTILTADNIATAVWNKTLP